MLRWRTDAFERLRKVVRDALLKHRSDERALARTYIVDDAPGLRKSSEMTIFATSGAQTSDFWPLRMFDAWELSDLGCFGRRGV